MQKIPLALIVFAVLLPTLTRADEITRQVQEELRQRHLYFNEIDGRSSPELQNALRHYQQRQGFAASGEADNATLRSLGIEAEPAPPAEGDSTLPDVPVLRSDEAVHDANARPELPPPPPKPARARPITHAEASEFVKHWLNAVQSPNLHDELAFYGDRVDYYDHGIVNRQYVQNELAASDQHWPRRTYKLAGPIHVQKKTDGALAKFHVAYQVTNGPANHHASGHIYQTVGIERRPDGGLELVSLREQRVRRVRHVASRPEDPVVRSLRHLSHNLFHR